MLGALPPRSARKRKHDLIVVRLASVIVVLAILSCSGDSTAPSVATTLTANSATSLTGIAGTAAMPPPSVIVKDQNDSPMGGVTVTLTVASGGGSVSSPTVTTDASGVATVGSWTLGPIPGINVLNATSGNLAGVAFTATSSAGAATSLEKSSGDNQSASASSPVPIPPAVIVKDALGNPTPGVSVTFVVASGGGLVTAAAVTTNASGIATVGSWTLGPVAGVNTLNAAAAGLGSVSFTATSTAGAVASLAKNSGDNQAAAAGSAVPIAPSVIVKDANGNAKPGVAVVFAIASGGGSVTGATVSTNAAGIATVGSWSLGPVAGVNVLSATIAGLGSVAFTATSIPGAAVSIAKNGGDNQTAAAGAAVPVPPSVILKDVNGNPVSGVSVNFAVVSGGGSITGSTPVTNAAGVATIGSWTLGSSAGTNALSATVAGLPLVTFTATALSGACGARSTHSFGTSSGGTLSSSDCQLSDGSFVDYFTTSVPQAGAYVFRQGAGFDTYLHLGMADGTTIGENDDEVDTGTNSGIKAILPAGNYLLGPGSFLPGVTGDYTISSATASGEVVNCENVFVVRGIATAQNITPTDCNLANPGATPIYSDAYFIFINAGQAVTINMTSGTLDSFLQLVRLDGVVMAENDNVDTSTRNSRITFTVAQSDYYAIFARSVPTSGTGAYTLTIQ